MFKTLPTAANIRSTAAAIIWSPLARLGSTSTTPLLTHSITAPLSVLTCYQAASSTRAMRPQGSTWDTNARIDSTRFSVSRVHGHCSHQMAYRVRPVARVVVQAQTCDRVRLAKELSTRLLVSARSVSHQTPSMRLTLPAPGHSSAQPGRIVDMSATATMRRSVPRALLAQ